ncbi:MAG: hypothetical protein WA979_03945, partial [Pacificimonas sp.]
MPADIFAALLKSSCFRMRAAFALCSLVCILSLFPVYANGDVSLTGWGVSVAAWMSGIVIALFLPQLVARSDARIWLALISLLVALTLFTDGQQGVYRWLRLGPVSVNATMLLLPGLIVIASRQTRNILPASASLFS